MATREIRTRYLRHPIKWLKGFAEERRGVSTVEYALIVVAIIAVVGGAAAGLGGAFNNLFNNLGNEISEVVT